MADKNPKSPPNWWKNKNCIKCNKPANRSAYYNHCWRDHQMCGKCSLQNLDCKLCNRPNPNLGKKHPGLNKGHISSLKGTKQTKEWIESRMQWMKDPMKMENRNKKISESKTGVKMTEQQKLDMRKTISKSKLYALRNKKISEMKKGIKMSIESIEKSKKAKQGKKINYPKGVIRNPESRIRRWFERLDQRIPRKRWISMWFSDTRKGEKGSFYGKHHSEKSKALLRQSHLGKTMVFSPQGLQNIINACKNRIWKESSRQKISDKRKNWVIPYKNSKPERMMQIALALNGIKFEKHKPFKLGKKWHKVDIFIEPNVVVEVDGVHYHIEKKDIQADLFQTQELTIMGYHVIRIRDKDILKDANKCSEKVIKLIKELQCSHFRLNQ